MTVLKFVWVENLDCTFSFCVSYYLKCGEWRRSEEFWQTITGNTTAFGRLLMVILPPLGRLLLVILPPSNIVTFCDSFETRGVKHMEITLNVQHWYATQRRYSTFLLFHDRELEYRSLHVCYVATPRCRPRWKDITTIIWINTDGKSKSNVNLGKQWTWA